MCLPTEHTSEAPEQKASEVAAAWPGLVAGSQEWPWPEHRIRGQRPGLKECTRLVRVPDSSKVG